MTTVVRFRALKVNPNVIDIAGATAGVSAYMNQYMQNIVDEVKPYPPPPPESTYVRTQELYSNWKVVPAHTVSSGGLEASIVNEATDRKRGRRYMTYVQGRFQTAQHRLTGWANITEVVAARRNEYRKGLQEVYKRNIRMGA